MERTELHARIVLAGLQCLQNIIERYPTDQKIFSKIFIGASGMAPEIMFQFTGNPHDNTTPFAEIELWMNGQQEGCRLFYSFFDRISDDIEMQNQDLNHPLEAQPFFEKVVQKFGLLPHKKVN